MRISLSLARLIYLQGVNKRKNRRYMFFKQMNVKVMEKFAATFLLTHTRLATAFFLRILGVRRHQDLQEKKITMSIFRRIRHSFLLSNKKMQVGIRCCSSLVGIPPCESHNDDERYASEIFPDRKHIASAGMKTQPWLARTSASRPRCVPAQFFWLDQLALADIP